MTHITSEESKISRFLFSDTRMAWFWFIVRLYVGWEWLSAGWEKVTGSGWVGSGAGTAMTGFVKGALGKTAGAHPDVSGWYGWFLTHAVLPHISVWSYAITFGEILVGVGLILGALTGIAAFFGFFMNLNYLLAGTVSTNPILLVLALLLMLAWKISGFVGADRYLLPRLGFKLQKK